LIEIAYHLKTLAVMTADLRWANSEKASIVLDYIAVRACRHAFSCSRDDRVRLERF
jgi:hypothetical protein